MKDINDYLPYYIGQPCIVINNIGEEFNDMLSLSILGETVLTGKFSYQIATIKPILCRLSDMSEEEIKELIGWEKMNLLYKDLRYKKHEHCINIEYTIDAGDEGCYKQFHSISFITPTADQFHYLLKQGFDLFGLLDAGLAIDAKTINKQE